MPQKVLTDFLAGSNISDKTRINSKEIGVGLDSCILPLKSNSNLYLIQSTDFFYPLIDDPFNMGMLTCANVLSDVYATGVTTIDSLAMILSISEKMSDSESQVVIPMIIKGFKNNAKIAGVDATIQSAVINPWLIMGGTATSVCTEKEFKWPLNVVPGDVLILTKPLGVQMACNAKRWSENPSKWENISKVLSLDQLKAVYNTAVKSMTRLNKTAAVLMHKYDAHAATDVTGFGLLGHAQNLAESQTKKVNFVIHSLPVIEHIVDVAKAVNMYEKFMRGTTPETSGGLLIAISKENACNYLEELKSLENWDAHIIGDVIEGDNEAEIIAEPNIITVHVL